MLPKLLENSQFPEVPKVDATDSSAIVSVGSTLVADAKPCPNPWNCCFGESCCLLFLVGPLELE